jgi:Tfp pilus assembly protein PilF
MSRFIRAAFLGVTIAAGASAAQALAAPAPPRAPAPGAAARPPAPVAPRPATRPTTRPDDALRRQKTIQALLTQADEAIAADDFKVARDSLLDLLQLDSKNPRALAGAGYTYLKLGQWPKAQESFENSIRYGEPLSKPVVISTAAALLRSKNPMRGVKFLRDYISAHPPDEDVLNAMATCLAQADNIARSNKYFQDSVKFYEAQNAKLEQTRSGEKRWGVEWLPAAEADRIQAKVKAEEAKLAAISRRLADAKARFNNAQNAYETGRKNKNKIGGSRINLPALEQDAQQKGRALAIVQKEYDEQWEKVPRPQFPTEVALVPMDLVADVALASAGTPGGPGETPGVPSSPGTVAPPSADPPPVTPGGTERPPVRPPVRPPPEQVAVGPAFVPPAPAPGPRRARTTQYAAAFPVAPDLLVTSAAAVDGATMIRVQGPDGDPFEATVLDTDDASGLALLKTKDGKRFAYLPVADTFAGGPVQCVSFPAVNLFDPVAEAFPGSALNPANLPAGQEKWAIKLSRHPRLGGSPLVVNGKVVGVQLATRDAEPGNVPAATLEDLKKLLGDKAPPHAGNADPRAVTMQLMAVREKA